MGPYSGVDYDSPYLIVNSIVSYPTPLQRERGEVGKISPYWLSNEHVCMCLLIPKTTLRKRESTEKGEGRGWELTLCLWIGILWILGNPMPELTFLPHAIAGFNSHKMNMNLGSEYLLRSRLFPAATAWARVRKWTRLSSVFWPRVFRTLATWAWVIFTKKYGKQLVEAACMKRYLY